MKLTEIRIKGIEEDYTVDMSKSVSNYLYQNTVDIGLLDKIKEMYYGSDVSLTDSEKDEILRLVQDSNMAAVQKLSLIEEIKRD